MQIKHRGFEVHYPTADSPVPWNQWEIVGMAAWLWTRSALHHSWDMRLFEQEVIDSVELGQFVLLTHQQRPAAYLSWAHLNDEAEVRYIANPHSLTQQDKHSGPHLWLLNWVAPAGGTEAFTWVAREHLFHSSVGHMLRVKPGNHEVARLVSARGARVIPQDYGREVLRMHANFEKAQRIRGANFAASNNSAWPQAKPLTDA